jgi:hypothetical protein
MSRGVIASLRDFVPLRPLTRPEAFRIAELQALRFLQAVHIGEPHVPERVITELPKVHVERFSPLPVSGATEWAHGRWLILLNGAEPSVRQRFSLAHEFKHILDHRFIAVLYQAIPTRDRAAFIEQLCDYFAGSLLVPRPWLKRAWGTGIQHLPDLATLFGVSQAAIQVRLAQTGLSTPGQRCAHTVPGWALPPAPGTGSSAPYQRTAALPIT